jgi:hypothetical protein
MLTPPHSLLHTLRLGQQLGADASFLQDIGVMDYSLLLGVHFCARARHFDGALAATTSGRHERMALEGCVCGCAIAWLCEDRH